MRDLYITRSGTLKRKDNSLELITENDKWHIPINEIDSIHILSDIVINSDFLEFMNKNKILIHFYNYYGAYSGSFIPPTEYPSGVVLVAQVEHYKSLSSRLYIAKEMVLSSIHNMKKVLYRYNIKTDEFNNIESRIKNKINNINDLMLSEANARKLYYSKFNLIINNNTFIFQARNRQPPTDPINALISYGNALLYNTCLSQIYKTQLDPRISYLHEPFERRNSLSLDIADIFKPLIVDKTIFNLINRKMLKEDDFERESDYCFLSKNGRRKFIQYYDERLRETIKHKSLKRNVSYKHLIKLECYKLINYFIEGKAYKGFKSYW